MTAKIKRFQPKEKQEKQQDLLELLSILERFPERKNNLSNPNIANHYPQEIR